MDLTVKPSDPEYTKLMNTETLPMLNDIELVLYGYIERYGAYGEFSSDLLDADAIKIRKQYMNRRKEENKIKEELEI